MIKLKSLSKKHLLALFISFGIMAVQASRNKRFDPETMCCDHFYYRAMTFNFWNVTREEFEKPQTDTLLSMYSKPIHKEYLRIENPLSKQPPYCYRILTPLLVSILPVDYKDGYYLVTYFSLSLTAFFLYYLMLELGFSYYMSLWSIAFFAILPAAIHYFFWNYMMNDPLLFLFFTGGLVCIVSKKDLLLAATMLFGVLNKETALLLIPCYYVYNVQKGQLLNFRLIKRVVLISCPGIIVYFLLRYLIYVPNPANIILKIFNIKNLGRIFCLEALTIWGFLGVFAIASFFKAPSSLKRLSIFIVLIYLQVIIGTHLSRLWIEAFPIVIPLSLSLFIDLEKKHKLIARILIVVTFALNLSYYDFFRYWWNIGV